MSLGVVPMPPETSSPAKTINVTMDLERAVDFADFLAARNKPDEAMRTLREVLSVDVRLPDVRRRYTELVLEIVGPQCPLGTIERGQLLLQLMRNDALTEAIEAAYLENLDRLLASRERRATPGTLVLGLGSGRCGSTSLARAFAAVEDVCATHENPPSMHWPPRPDQLRVHKERFRRLLPYFRVVFDAAHWWLNAAERIIPEFDKVKMIALVRNSDDCARSFLAVKGTGRNWPNHWLDHDGTFWLPGLWDSFYPHYPPERFGLAAPMGLSAEELAARQHQLVQTYVSDYNRSLFELKNRVGERLLMVRTEELSEPRTRDVIEEFLGQPGIDLQTVFNRGNLSDGDGDSQELLF